MPKKYIFVIELNQIQNIYIDHIASINYKHNKGLSVCRFLIQLIKKKLLAARKDI